MGIRQRVYWAMALVLCWTVLGSRGLAAGRYRVVLTPTLPGSMAEGGFAVVAVEVKDASGVSVPLYLSQISATWDGEPATLIPTDAGWPSFLAAYIPHSKFNPNYLKSLQKDASFLTDESIARVFQSPHTRFWMRKSNLKSGKIWVSVTTALLTETVSGSLALTVSTQAVSATQVPDVKFSVNPDPIDLSKPFTILVTMVAPDVDEVALCFQGGSVTGFGTPPGTLVARFGNVIHFGSFRVFPQGSQIAIGIDPTLPPASGCGSSTCAKPNQYPVSGTVHRACCFFLRGAGACFDIAPRAQGLRVNIQFREPFIVPSGPTLGDIEPHSSLVTISVTDAAGNLVPNRKIKIQIGPKADSGGHASTFHGKPRPVGVLSGQEVQNVGAASPQQIEQFISNGGTPDVVADLPTGQAILTYTAGRYSGSDFITVTDTATKVQSTKGIQVKVPALLNAETEPPMLGHTNFVGTTQAHVMNHYLTVAALNDLAEAAKEYHLKTGDLFPMNDASLENGGGFDVGGDWYANSEPDGCFSSGHCGHRRGKQVDVQILNVRRMRALIPIMRDHNWKFFDELQFARQTPTIFPTPFHFPCHIPGFTLCPALLFPHFNYEP